MYNPIDPEIDRFSKNLWRPSRLKTEGRDRTSTFAPAPRIRPETPNEAQFFELPTSHTNHTENISPANHGPSMDSTVESLAASATRSSAKLQKTLESHSKSDYKLISTNELAHLREANPIVYDRIDALSNEQRRGLLAAGNPDALTLLIPSSRQTAGISEVDPSQAVPKWEEVFHSQRSPSGATEVVGKRFHQGDWYHFSSRIATPPRGYPGSEPNHSPSAPRASTLFASDKVNQKDSAANHTKPADVTDQDLSNLIHAVRGITEGPWKPYLQGRTLKGSDHDVKGVKKSDKPNGMKAFKAKFDSVMGVLKGIQDVAKGIQQAAEFLGLLGELGKFGDVLSWIGSIKLPKKPADLINSILTGSGILPGKAEPTQGLICMGSGEGGLVVTKGGAAAAAFGNGLVNQVGVLQNGDGSAPKAPEAKNKTVPAKGPKNPNKNPQDDPSKKEPTGKETSQGGSPPTNPQTPPVSPAPQAEGGPGPNNPPPQPAPTPTPNPTDPNQVPGPVTDPTTTNNTVNESELAMGCRIEGSKKYGPENAGCYVKGTDKEIGTVAEAGPFELRHESSTTVELGAGMRGGSGAIGKGTQFGIHNPNNNDSFYAGCNAQGGTPGNNSAGCQIGLTAGRDDSNTFGVSLGIGTNNPLGISRECVSGGDSGPQVQTTINVPVRIPLVPTAPLNMQVSERHPDKDGICAQAFGVNNTPPDNH